MDALHTLYREAVRICFIATAPVVLLGFYCWPRFPHWGRRAYVVCILACIAVLGRYLLKQVFVTIDELPEYHIRTFWLFGRVAATGGNFYLPEALQHAWGARQASPAFGREILEVGFPYPPATILLFAPLGHLTLWQAACVWQAVSVGSVVASIVLLWRMFLPVSGALGLGVMTALVLGLRATHWNIELTQTSNLMLLFVTLAWALREKPLGGIFVAFGTVVKPIVALLGLHLLLRRAWRSIAIALGTYLALTAATVALFGWVPLLSFVSDSPLRRLPAWAYTGHNSESLLAVALRASGVGPWSQPLAHPMANPLFLVLASAVLTATLVLMYGLLSSGEPQASELAMAICICAALLLYPNTLNHYSVLLLPPLTFLWSRCEDLGVPPLIAIGVVCCAYWLVLVNGGDSSTLATVLTWCVLGIVGARLIARSRHPFDVLPVAG